MITQPMWLDILQTAVAILAGFMIGYASRPREVKPSTRIRTPRNDALHATEVYSCAYALNEAMAAARAVDLNPCVSISPIDPELPPGLRPFVVGLQREGILVDPAK